MLHAHNTATAMPRLQSKRTCAMWRDAPPANDPPVHQPSIKPHRTAQHSTVDAAPAPRGEMPQPQRSSGSDQSRSHMGPSCGTSCSKFGTSGRAATRETDRMGHQRTRGRSHMGPLAAASAARFSSGGAQATAEQAAAGVHPEQHLSATACQQAATQQRGASTTSHRTAASKCFFRKHVGHSPAPGPAPGCGLVCLASATGRHASRRSGGRVAHGQRRRLEEGHTLSGCPNSRLHSKTDARPATGAGCRMAAWHASQLAQARVDATSTRERTWFSMSAVSGR